MGCIGFRPLRKVFRKWKTTVYILGMFLLLQIFINISTSNSDQSRHTRNKFQQKNNDVVMAVLKSQKGHFKSLSDRLRLAPNRVEHKDNGINNLRVSVLQEFGNVVNFPKYRVEEPKNPLSFYDKELPDFNQYKPKCSITLPDAKSAISRSKTNRCKQEIADVACKMQNLTLLPSYMPRYCQTEIADLKPAQAPRLDNDDDIEPARICYMLVVHGRAYRQFARLFKAIYHERHFFYIHVDKRSNYLHREIKKITSKYPNVLLTPWRMSTIWGGASLLQMLLRSIKDALYIWKEWDFFINLSGLDFPIQNDLKLSRFLSYYRDKSFMKSHGRSDEKFIQKQGLNRVFVECEEHMWRLGPRSIPEGIKISGGSDWLALNRELCNYSIYGKDQLLYSLKEWYQYTLLPVESFFHTLSQNRENCHSFVDNNLRVTNWNRARGCKCQYKHIVDWCGCSPNDFFPSDLNRLKTSRPVFFARKFEEVVNQESINILDFKIYGEYPPQTPSLNSYWENCYDAEDGMTSVNDVTITTYTSFARLALKDLNLQISESQVAGDLIFDQCQLLPQQVKTVHIYKRNEEFIGYLVTMEASWKDSMTTVQLQAMLSPSPLLNVHDPESILSTRLQSAEVGTNWDVKELIFRDWAGIIGPESSPRLIVRWKKGDQDFVVTSVVVDPFNVVCDYTDFRTPSKSAGVTETLIGVRKPLRPGKWKIFFFVQRDFTKPSAQLEFVVSPIEFRGGKDALHHLEYVNRGTVDDEAVNSANHNLYTIRKRLNLKRDDEAAKITSERASHISGSSLHQWIDEVLTGKWSVRDICMTSQQSSDWKRSLPSTCKSFLSILPSSCSNLSWSSFSPDPKSDLGEVSPDGRIR